MKVVASIFLFVFLLSCSNDIPRGVLDQKKMQDVFADMLLAEGFAENFLVLDSAKTREEWFSQEYSKVMAIHKISQEDFKKSLDFYKKRPDLFKVILDTVYQRGQRMRDQGFKKNEKTLPVE